MLDRSEVQRPGLYSSAVHVAQSDLGAQVAVVGYDAYVVVDCRDDAGP
jgi:hypothetical protein